MRYGTRTHLKRRWGRRGHRPVCPVKIGYDWGFLYVALCPFDGDLFAMILPRLNQTCFDIFVRELAAHIAQRQLPKKALLIGDGASAHAPFIMEQHGIDWQKLPSACPELNPVERFFEEIRRVTANNVFETVVQIEALIINELNHFFDDTKAVKSIAGYSYIIRRD